MSLSVEIIKKRKNTTAPWEVRAIQSVIKQNFLDSPVLYRCTRKYIGRGVHGCTFFIRDGSHRLCELSVPPRTAVVPRNSDVLAGRAYQNSRPRIDKDVNSWTWPAGSQDSRRSQRGSRSTDNRRRSTSRDRTSYLRV